MRVKEESAKDGLKLNIQKTKIMASGFITSRQTDEETMETVTDLLFLGSKKWLWMVTAAMKLKDACSLEEKLCKPRQCIKKQRHHFADQGLHSQSYGFSVAMYRCEIWTLKKAEHQRSDALELWYWRRLESPLVCKKIKPISPRGTILYSHSLLKLKLQYFSHLMQRADSLEKTLMLRKIGKRRRGRQMK